MNIISVLVMLFILAVFALTGLIVLIRILRPHKRKIYKHQVVKRGSDPLPYQLDYYGSDCATEDPPSQEFVNMQRSGKMNLDWSNRFANRMSSDRWKARINR